MVWAKRAAAAAVAAGLIVAAVLIRDNVIDDGDDNDGPSADEASGLVCLDELASICAAADVDFRSATVDEMIDAWSERNARPSELWFTIAPMPDVVLLRRGNDPLELEVRPVAASPLSLVVPSAKAPQLEAACPALDWRCIGELAGDPWAESDGTVRPALPALDSGTGRVAIAAVVRGFFGDASIAPDDPAFITWSRTLERTTGRVQLSAGTPIATMLTRPSALDVAVGAEAELSNSRRGEFTVLYAEPMSSVDLVLAAPPGVALPDSVLGGLRAAAIAAGWQEQTPGEPPAASDLEAAVAAWEQL